MKISGKQLRLMPKVQEILEKHVGKKNAIHAREIRDAIGIEDGDTFAQTRNIIEHVLRESDLPVGALAGGYFVISNKEELDECLGALDTRALQINDRKARIFQNFTKRYGPLPIQEDEDYT